MIVFFLYLALLLAATGCAIRWGGRDERLSSAVIFTGSLLTAFSVYVTQIWFDQLQLAVLAVDALVLACLYRIALTSKRFWPLTLPAFHLIGFATHMVKLVAPTMLPLVYGHLQGFWAYPMLAMIIAAALWKRSNPSANRRQNTEKVAV